MRTTVLLTIGVTALLVGGLPAVAAASGTAPQVTPQVNDSENVTPGERLGGIIGVQQAEIDGELRERSFAIGLERAGGNQSQQADRIAQEYASIDERLAVLENRTANLTEQRENGSISEGQYRAQIAQIEAQRASLQRLANQSNETAAGLPNELLEERGINATRIGMLQQRASELGGQEVAAIARGIAGNDVGQGFGPRQGPPVNVTPGEPGPPGAGNETPGGPPENQTAGSGNDQPGPPMNKTPGNNGGGPPGNQTGGPNETPGN